MKQNILYHATYKALLPKIKEFGLDTTKSKKVWEDSVAGYVYLAYDKDVAVSYAESSEMVPESWLDNIIVLSIDATKLDPTKLFVDGNVRPVDGENEDTLEYRGIIPYSDIIKIEKS